MRARGHGPAEGLIEEPAEGRQSQAAGDGVRPVVGEEVEELPLGQPGLRLDGHVVLVHDRGRAVLRGPGPGAEEGLQAAGGPRGAGGGRPAAGPPSPAVRPARGITHLRISVMTMPTEAGPSAAGQKPPPHQLAPTPTPCTGRAGGGASPVGVGPAGQGLPRPPCPSPAARPPRTRSGGGAGGRAPATGPGPPAGPRRGGADAPGLSRRRRRGLPRPTRSWAWRRGSRRGTCRAPAGAARGNARRGHPQGLPRGASGAGGRGAAGRGRGGGRVGAWKLPRRYGRLHAVWLASGSMRHWNASVRGHARARRARRTRRATAPAAAAAGGAGGRGMAGRAGLEAARGGSRGQGSTGGRRGRRSGKGGRERSRAMGRVRLRAFRERR